MTRSTINKNINEWFFYSNEFVHLFNNSLPYVNCEISAFRCRRRSTSWLTSSPIPDDFDEPLEGDEVPLAFSSLPIDDFSSRWSVLAAFNANSARSLKIFDK
jgi:hypothetical protein